MEKLLENFSKNSRTQWESAREREPWRSSSICSLCYFRKHFRNWESGWLRAAAAAAVFEMWKFIVSLRKMVKNFLAAPTPNYLTVCSLRKFVEFSKSVRSREQKQEMLLPCCLHRIYILNSKTHAEEALRLSNRGRAAGRACVLSAQWSLRRFHVWTSRTIFTEKAQCESQRLEIATAWRPQTEAD